jgi:hypothetical protein
MKKIKKYSLDIKYINSSAKQIIENLKDESLGVYLFLQNHWREVVVTEDVLFQFVFRSFYRMDNAGLSEDLKKQFFIIMENNRMIEHPDIYTICLELYKIKNLKGQNSIQFSFVTKLANTINPLLPIYDSNIALMYGYNNITNKCYKEKIKNLTDFYQTMSCDYGFFIKNGDLETTLTVFDKIFPAFKDSISVNKKLDFIIWSAGKLHKLKRKSIQ